MNKTLRYVLTGVYGLLALTLTGWYVSVNQNDLVVTALLLAIMGVAIVLLSELEKLDRNRLDSQKAIAELTMTKDGAYRERNVLVSALASIYPAGIRPTTIEGWDPEWENCVYIDLPGGQVSFHYHTSEASRFAHLPPYEKPYDGHSKETAMARISQLTLVNGLVPTAWVADWTRRCKDRTINATNLTSDEEHAILSTIGSLNQDLAARTHAIEVPVMIDWEAIRKELMDGTLSLS